MQTSPIRILLTGKNGQIGWELAREMAGLAKAAAIGRDEMDLSSADSIRAAIRDAKPDIIINAAAYTAVDKAESEPDIAMAVNGVAPGIIAEEAKKVGAILVHYSTDYVFDGTKKSAYTEDDTPNPLNVYGATKLAGEKAVLASGCGGVILRTSWVYAARGGNFVRTMLRLAGEREELKIVSDQRGAPTWARMIAKATTRIVTGFQRELTHPARMFHLTAAGETSWCGFAQRIFEHGSRLGLINLAPRVIPVSTADYKTPARRPLNSAMACGRIHDAFGVTPPDWEDSLKLCMAELAAGNPGKP
ncbi:MAG: dTDP-4-dehydrorhamnose reductase [Nitrospinae bacterium]|nr:dTDP-4-dehydrorhamnose reductase [Nitrospinota bacterium]